MALKEKRVFIRVTPEEHEALRRKAKGAEMTVSEYARSVLLYSDDGTIVTISTEPLKSIGYELTKQGVNLNQLMHWLNTYKGDAEENGAVEAMLRREGELFIKVMETLAALRREAARKHVHILKEKPKFSDE